MKSISPLLLVNKDNPEEKEYLKYVTAQIKKGVFLFKVREREIELARKLEVDILKNFIIKNSGEFAISIKNIYIEG